MKLATVLTLCLIFFGSAHAEQYTGAFSAWPPFVDDDRSDDGIFSAIVRDILAEQNDTVEYHEIRWALDSVLEGHHDFYVGLWHNEEREVDYIFSDPIIYNRIVFISNVDTPYEFNGLASLDGKKVGLRRDYGYGDDFMNYQGYQREILFEFISLVKLVRFGGLEVTLEDEVVAREEIRIQAPEYLDYLHFSENALSENGLHLACSRQNPRCAPFISRLNNTLAAMRSDGRMAALLSNYGLRE